MGSQCPIGVRAHSNGLFQSLYWRYLCGSWLVLIYLHFITCTSLPFSVRFCPPSHPVSLLVVKDIFFARGLADSRPVMPTLPFRTLISGSLELGSWSTFSFCPYIARGLLDINPQNMVHTMWGNILKWNAPATNVTSAPRDNVNENGNKIKLQFSKETEFLPKHVSCNACSRYIALLC